MTAKKAAEKSAKQAEKIKKQLGIDTTPQWDKVAELKKFKGDIEGANGKTVALSFYDLCEKSWTLKQEIDFRKAKLDMVNEQIELALTVAGVEKVLWEDRPVQVVESNSGPQIQATLLMQKGVDPDVIAACTTPGKGYSYVLMGKPKGN